MKEPEQIGNELHVLTLFGDRFLVITREQVTQIMKFQDEGVKKSVSVGFDVIMLNQISGMPTLKTYREQMKTALAMRSQRMCRRCGAILAMQDRCACQDSSLNPEEKPTPYLERSAQSNPAVRKYLDTVGYNPLQIAAPLPELPDDPVKAKAYQLAKAHIMQGTPRPELKPDPNCIECKGEGKYPLQGVIVTCNCIVNLRLAERAAKVRRAP